ncbi:hypothetical protein KPL40_05870 [Clostridium gasigenes]|uniref:hypothetical protein n=1 Tax=Clostridium gasigenes TaxID=94869 RepID=UPI001C0C25C3|nr:hypothetical protein [Clostridium gasigenes]MBU3131973.1 hypothetical protein [Clostridium gasigenes]
MKYYYEVTFYLANEEKRKEVNLNDYEDAFLMAERHYNSVGKNARNVKRIINRKVDESELKLQLESDAPLSTPTLALRSYSQFLVQTNFGEVAAKDNALFRGSSVVIEMEHGDITAPEMIKILAELLMAGKKSDVELIGNIQNQLMNWRDNQ